MPIQLDTSELVGTLIESVLYGVAMVFGIKTYTFFRRSNKKYTNVNFMFMFTLWCLIFLSTVHIIIDWHRMIIAFIEKDTRADRILFLADFNYSKANIKNSWTYLIKLLVYVLQTFIGDFIMAYRCYLVWRPNLWLGLFPSIVSLATLVGGLGAIGISVRSSNFFLGQLSQFITCFWVATVVTNVASTGLILIRLWISNRARKFAQSTFSLAPIVIVLVESGSLYCGMCIIAFALYQTQSFLDVTILNLLPGYILILFSFVLLQIVEKKNQDTVAATQSRVGVSRSIQFRKPTEVSVTQMELETIEQGDGDRKYAHVGDTSTRGTHSTATAGGDPYL